VIIKSANRTVPGSEMNYTGTMGDGQLVVMRKTRWRVPMLVRVLWRFFITGKNLYGPGDNATFLHDATIDYRGRPYEKLTRARWRRVARRWSFAGVPLLFAMIAGCARIARWSGSASGQGVGGWAALPWGRMLAGYLTLCAIGWIAYGVRRVTLLWPDRHLRKEFAWPATQVLSRETGAKIRRRDVSRLIELPPGFGRGIEDDNAEEVPVRVYMPAVMPLPDKLKDRIVTSISSTLGMPGARGQWREAGARPYVDIFPPPTPPKTVTFVDVQRAMLEAPAHAPVAGLAAGKRVVHEDLEQDSPHIALSGPSGTGKSVFLKFLLCQRMRHGTGTIMFDYKRWSHRWLHNMPANYVLYLWRIEEMHDGLVSIGEELHRRISADEEEQEFFRTYDIVVEEINSLIRALNRYWKGKRREIMRAAKEAREAELDYDPADLDPPLQSPAVAALQEGVGMGRELRMHWWAVAQRLSAGVFGGNGGDIRESFQIRNIARWDRALWRMLVGGLKYVSCPPGPRGIWGCNIGEEFNIFRVPFLTDAQAREWATGGVEVSSAVLSPQRSVPHSSASSVDHQGRRAISSRVTLRQAVEELPRRNGGGGFTLEGLRTAAKREGFPPSLGVLEDGRERGAHLYDLEELISWSLTR
jgi:hypothetical protein